MCTPKVYSVSSSEWAFLLSSVQRFPAGWVLFNISFPYPETWDKQVMRQRLGRVDPQIGKQVFASCIAEEIQEVWIGRQREIDEGNDRGDFV